MLKQKEVIRNFRITSFEIIFRSLSVGCVPVPGDQHISDQNAAENIGEPVHTGKCTGNYDHQQNQEGQGHHDRECPLILNVDIPLVDG